MSLISPSSGFFQSRDASLTSLRTPGLTHARRVHAFVRPEWYRSEWAQLGRGNLEFAITQVSGRDILLHEIKVGPLLAGQVAIDSDWLVLFAPLRWQGDFLLSGQVSRPNDLFLLSDPSGYSTFGQDRHNFIVGLRKARIRAVCAVLSGDPDSSIDFFNAKLTRASSAGAVLESIVKSAMPDLRQSPYSRGQYYLPTDVENEIITGVALLLLEQREDIRERDPGRLDPLEIVRKATACVTSNPGQRVTLADLCAASGVGKVTLHKCFSDLLGVSPMAYVRARRFSEARLRLLDPTDLPRSVKDLSLSLGFTNGGRFAADYQNLFGESPSDTLAATLAQDPDIPRAFP